MATYVIIIFSYPIRQCAEARDELHSIQNSVRTIISETNEILRSYDDKTPTHSKSIATLASNLFERMKPMHVHVLEVVVVDVVLLGLARARRLFFHICSLIMTDAGCHHPAVPDNQQKNS